MGRTLVIAECGSSWDCDLSKAFRLIDAAKACDADVAKFQWTSNAFAMARRRGLGSDAAAMYVKYLQYPVDTLRKLKAHCDEVGIEFMVTVYLIEDIATIAPLVKRFKVSAFESMWEAFVQAHPMDRGLIISFNDYPKFYTAYCNPLYCVSKYPTAIEDLNLGSVAFELQREGCYYGLSDHTTSTLTGALAVAAGATIVEKHIRLVSTSHDNPDYPHSMTANCPSLDSQGDWGCEGHRDCFAQYVSNIREAEAAL